MFASSFRENLKALRDHWAEVDRVAEIASDRAGLCETLLRIQKRCKHSKVTKLVSLRGSWQCNFCEAVLIEKESQQVQP